MTARLLSLLSVGNLLAFTADANVAEAKNEAAANTDNVKARFFIVFLLFWADFFFLSSYCYMRDRRAKPVTQ
jgi:hypothetical protein